MKIKRRQTTEKREKVDPMKVLLENKDKALNIESELENQGLIFFDPNNKLNINEDYLTLPAEITEVSTRDLGELLNAFTQQKVYMRTLLCHAELLCEQARRNFTYVSSPIYSALAKTKLSEKAKDREVASNETVKPYYEELCSYQKKCRMIEYNISNIEDIIFMISREVSRRSSDFDNENRNYNVNR